MKYSTIRGFGLALIFSFIFALSGTAFAQRPGILAYEASYAQLPGLDITTVTELSKSGWLRYCVISVDTMTGDFYVGPFNGGSFMDEPSSVIDTLRSKGLLAAINGDFFDTASGMPLSMVVSDGSLIRSPRREADFATICIPGAGSAYIEKFSWSARLVRPDGGIANISSYNELSIGSSDAVLFNALRSDRKYPAKAAVALIKGNAVIALFKTGLTGIPDDKSALSLLFDYELITTGSAMNGLIGLKVGDAIRLEFSLFPPFPMESAFSGKPILVKDGLKQKNLSSFTSISGTLRAPRTMAGITWDGRLLLVAVEGRSLDSRGLTLDEAAQLMMDLGCRDALNLDGGGSTQAAASDGLAAYKLIGASGADRKVSYSVGIKAIDGRQAMTYPVLNAAPAFGPAFDIQAVGLHGEPGAAYEGLIAELPIVTVGTHLYFATEADAFSNLRIVHGDLVQLPETPGFTVASEGYIELRSGFEGVETTYKMLATGKPFRVALSSMNKTDIGLSLGIQVFDYKGRAIPLPSAGLRMRVITQNGAIELPAPLIPQSALESSGGIEAIEIYFEDALLKSFSNVAFFDGLDDTILLDKMDDASMWTSYGSPEASLKGMLFEDADGRTAMGLAYDFTGTGVRAAYAKPLARIPIPATATALSVMANADFATGHWLRANVRDAADVRHFLDFGRLAGTGWNEYRASLPAVEGPFTIEQVYLAEFRDDMASEGTVYIDDLAAIPAEGHMLYLSDSKGTQITPRIAYSHAEDVDMSMEAGIIADYGPSAVPGKAAVLRLDATGGSAYMNGIGQWQKLFEACTSPGKSGILIIEVKGLKQRSAAGSSPLQDMKDENEKWLLKAAAVRALYMGYSEVIIIEFGSEERLAVHEHGVLYLAMP